MTLSDNDATTVMALTLPEAWEEVPQDAWPHLVGPILSGDSALSRTLSLRTLLQANLRPLLEGHFMLLDPVHLKDLAECLGWMWSQNMTIPPFESFKHGGTEYFLPAKGLSNITLIEFAYVDLMYNLYVMNAQADDEQKAASFLQKLVCYLCRPIDPRIDADDPSTFKGDNREMFNTIICDRRLPAFETLPNEIILPVLLFFVGCKSQIHKDYEGTIFMPPAEDGSQVSGGRAMEPTEWLDICFHLSGGKFGTVEQTMQTNLHTILYYLSHQERQAIKKETSP